MYSAVSLTLVREQRFIRSIYYYYTIGDRQTRVGESKIVIGKEYVVVVFVC